MTEQELLKEFYEKLVEAAEEERSNGHMLDGPTVMEELLNR